MLSRFSDTAIFPALRKSSVVDPASGSPELKDEIIALFNDLRDPLLRYLSSFGVALCDGEEVIQEAFLALFQHLQAGKPRDNLRGWLFRVAHNLALRQRYQDRRGAETTTAIGLFEGSAIDPSPTTEESLINEERLHRMQSVLAALPAQDRQCLVLRAEGLRYREISEVLDMSLGAVSLSLARSLARIGRAAER